MYRQFKKFATSNVSNNCNEGIHVSVKRHTYCSSIKKKKNLNFHYHFPHKKLNWTEKKTYLVHLLRNMSLWTHAYDSVYTKHQINWRVESSERFNFFQKKKTWYLPVYLHYYNLPIYVYCKYDFVLTATIFPKWYCSILLR